MPWWKQKKQNMDVDQEKRSDVGTTVQMCVGKGKKGLMLKNTKAFTELPYCTL